MALENKIPYRVNSQKAIQLIFAGGVASIAMVAFAFLLRAIGIAAPDYAAQYGGILNGQVHPESLSDLWWGGMFWHLVNGTFIFPFIYDYLTHTRVLPSERKAKRFMFGAGIWFFSCAIIAPIAGEGFFFRELPHPILLTITNFLSWICYTFILDEMIRARVVHHLGVSGKQAA